MLTISNLENGEAIPFIERKSCLGESTRQSLDRVNTRCAYGCRRAKRRDPLTTIPNRSSSNRFGPNRLTKQSVSITKPIEHEDSNPRAHVHFVLAIRSALPASPSAAIHKARERCIDNDSMKHPG